MAAAEQLVEGVGDEVVLFAVFLLLSMCFFVWLSLRGNRGTQQRGRSAGEQAASVGNERADESAATSSPLPSPMDDEGENVMRQIDDDVRGETLSFDPISEQRGGGEDTVRARYPQRQSDEGEEESLSIRLILPNNSTLTVNAQRSTTLGELRRMHFQEQLSERRPVWFIYQGRVLDNDAQTLQEVGVGPHHALHVHIGRPSPLDGQENQNIGPQPPGQMLDLSQLILPLFGLIIAICWVCMFCFPYVFTLVTKILLFVLSLVYVFMTYVMTRTNTT